MSKVVIEIDTKTKVATASVDGNALPDFYSAMLYFNPKAPSDSSYRMSLELCCMAEGEEDEGEMRKVTRYCASENGELGVANSVEKQIEEYFSK